MPSVSGVDERRVRRVEPQGSFERPALVSLLISLCLAQCSFRRCDAILGPSSTQLRKRGRKPIGDGPGQVVPVRIDATLLAALTERAERDHVSRSEAIRAAIRSYVA